MPSHANPKRRGTQRERAVKEYYEGLGWMAFRAPASLGCADVVAMRKSPDYGGYTEVELVECKSTAKGPYEHFSRKERERLRKAAEQIGAGAVLAWWPSRGRLKLIDEHEWPQTSAPCDQITTRNPPNPSATVEPHRPKEDA